MDQRSANFAAQLMETFKVEAEEHLINLTDGLMALEKGLPADNVQDTIEIVFREAHSLKGAARAVDLIQIQEICQSLENVLSDLRCGKQPISAINFDKLYQALDQITTTIGQPTDSNHESLKILAQNLFSSDITSKASQEPCFIRPENQKLTPAQAKSPASVKTIRVSIEKLDKLMQEVEELLAIKILTQQRCKQMNKISQKMLLWKKTWHDFSSSLKNFRLHHANNGIDSSSSKDLFSFIENLSPQIDELNNDIQDIHKECSLDTRVVTSMIDGLLENTKKVLMQPFAALFDVFPKMVRDLANSLGKKINLSLDGGDIEIDRRILEEMKDPLMHLIRNCIDHGIATPQARQQRGKAPIGEITLSIIQKSGNQVEIVLHDDGEGIDLVKVKNVAEKNGLLAPSEIAHLTDDQAIMLIFKSGLSTSPIVTDISGRGIGMGIVLEKVEKLGGHLKVASQKHIGTTFRLSLPLTLATFRGIHVIASDKDFIFPTHHLIRVIRITADEIKTVEGQPTLMINNHLISFIHLNQLLSLPHQLKPRKRERYMIALVIKALDTTIAIGVDQVLNEQQIFLKGLGKQLSRVKNISGATIMESGTVIPILDPFDIVKSLSKMGKQKTIDHSLVEKSSIITVLVVDDSVTSRVLLKNILESAGFKVLTAIDGQEALTMIKTQTVALLLSDVEMPRMGGFKLTQELRSIEKFKELPIILCTSRGSREDKEHGIEIGANAYIDKSSFTQNILLEIINNLIGQHVT